MTNHNNAAQSAMQETVLTDLEIQETLGAIFVASHPYGRRDVLSQWKWEKAAARAIESALLSKLRAPVADERQGDIAAALQDCAYCAGIQRGFELGNHNDNDGLRRALESRDGYVKTIKDARAALASAPVAGEARMPPGYRVKVVEGHGYRITAPSGSDWVAHSGTPAGDLIAALYAAPQASEAVPIGLLATEHTGMRVDYSGLLKQARSALEHGETEPALAEMLRQFAGHLEELGQRWYAGDVAVVDELLQLYCVESEVRAALSAQPGAQRTRGCE